MSLSVLGSEGNSINKDSNKNEGIERNMDSDTAVLSHSRQPYTSNDWISLRVHLFTTPDPPTLSTAQLLSYLPTKQVSIRHSRSQVVSASKHRKMQAGPKL